MTETTHDICENNCSIVAAEIQDKRNLAISWAFSYFDDLAESILEDAKAAQKGATQLSKEQHERLKKLEKVVHKIGGNKEILKSIMCDSLNNSNSDDIYELCNKAYDVLMSNFHLAFDMQKFKYAPLFNNVGSNQLSVLATTKPDIDKFSNSATFSNDTTTAVIEKFLEARTTLRPSTCKLLDTLTILLTAQNSCKGKNMDRIKPDVTISLSDYMDICGIPITEANKNFVRTEVKKDLDILTSLKLSWREKSKRSKNGHVEFINVSSSGKFDKGVIKFRFGFDFVESISKYITQFPISLLQLDSRNKMAYAIGRRLSEHYGNDNNRTKGSYDIITVKKLIEICGSLPTYEDVQSGRHSAYERIIQPIENALNILTEKCGFQWQYCSKNKSPLTIEQIDGLSRGDYYTFENLSIKYDIIGFPIQEKRLQKKLEQREQKKAVAKAKTRKTTSKKP